MVEPFGEHTPHHGAAPRVAIVALVGLVGVASLAAGVYLGVGDILDRRREVVHRDPDPVTTTAPGTTTTMPIGTTVAIDPTVTMVLTDDTGHLSITVPVGWSDTSGDAWDRDGTPVGIQVGAATDLTAWQSGWGTPGVFVGVTDVVTADEAFGDWSDACAGRDPDAPFQPPGLQGTLQVWVGCGEEASSFLVGVAQVDASTVLVYQAVVLTEADRVAADQVVTTLSYQP